MKTFLPLVATFAFILPLLAEEEPEPLPATARITPPPTTASVRIAAYLERLAPNDSQRNEPSIPSIITIVSIEPAEETLDMDGTPCICDLLRIETTVQVDGLPITFSREWYQNSGSRKLPVDTPETTSYTCLLTPVQLQTMATALDSRMPPKDTDAILGNIRPAAPRKSIELVPDIADRLCKEYVAKHPEAHEDMQEIIRPGYDVTIIEQEENDVAIFTPKEGDAIELLQSERFMDIIPLPQEDYFIVVDHPERFTVSMQLYKVGGSAWNSSPGALSCVFQPLGEYDIQWFLVSWNWQDGTMTVRRKEHRWDAIDFIIPIR